MSPQTKRRWRFLQTLGRVPQSELDAQVSKLEEVVYHLNRIPGRRYGAVVRTFYRSDDTCDLEFSYGISATSLDKAYCISSMVMSNVDFTYLLPKKPQITEITLRDES